MFLSDNDDSLQEYNITMFCEGSVSNIQHYIGQRTTDRLRLDCHGRLIASLAITSKDTQCMEF